MSFSFSAVLCRRLSFTEWNYGTKGEKEKKESRRQPLQILADG